MGKEILNQFPLASGHFQKTLRERHGIEEPVSIDCRNSSHGSCDRSHVCNVIHLFKCSTSFISSNLTSQVHFSLDSIPLSSGTG